MNIGVTGSVGYLGANLVETLHRRLSPDDRIVCYYSRRRSNPLTDQLDLTYRHMDVTSREEVLEQTTGIDLLFHMAGLVDYSRRNARRSWEVNVLGTRNVFDAVLQNRIRKLVYASSINVLGPVGGDSDLGDETNDGYGSKNNPISFADREATLAAVHASVGGTCDFPRNSRVVYFDSKLAGYELAREYCKKFDLPVTIVLPGTAVGAGDVGVSISRLVMETYRGRLKLTLPGGTSFVAASDVAEGFHLASLHGRSGQAYIITGFEEDNLSYREFMRLVVKVARSRYGRDLPDRFFTVPGSLCPALSTMFRLLPVGGPLSEALILSGAVTHRFSSRKAGEELGYGPVTSLERAIQSCIDFYIRNQLGDS